MNGMKKTLRSLGALACSAMCLGAVGQEKKDVLPPGTYTPPLGTYVPPLGTKTLYRPGNDTDAPAPAGYSPFFINYVGRHGARHATGDGEFLRLQRCLQEAADAGALEPEGIRLQRMIAAIAAVEKKYPAGTLTAIGESEQYTIGKDMGDRYPDVVRRPDDCLEIVTTPELRTVQSAEQFLKGLASSAGCVTRSANDSIRLRFFSLSPAYAAFVKKGDWHKAQEQLESSPTCRQVDEAILRRFFRADWVPKLVQGQVEGFARPDAFVMAVYAAAVIAPGLRQELQLLGYRPEDADIFSLLTAQEASELDLIDAAKDFFVKGPGLDSMGIQTRVAAPLLADFIESADRWLAAGHKGADLRFAHAETIAPIAALMGCEGAATAIVDPLQYGRVWHADRVMGYSANIQWVFYRDASDNVLVKVLYNERPVMLPISTESFPYYSWNKLRDYYLHKLQTLDLAPGEDMYAWLQRLK